MPDLYAVLACPMGANDANASTVREYLGALLVKVWDENEGFDGKRPFGNSGWDGEVYSALIEAGLLAGKLDEWGGIEECDYSAAHALVRSAVVQMTHAEAHHG